MGKYIIATIKSWNIENAQKIAEQNPDKEILIINNPEELTVDIAKSYDPAFIFFPHWSWIIPEELYSNYNCVVFHMTDLPFGRGGSPLQNLIERGIYDTKISAIKVCKELDAGPIYLKESLNISNGSADEILKRVSEIIFNSMIPRFFKDDKLTSHEQTGEIVTFKRRTSDQSEIPEGLSQRQIYDYIRMLDGEGYPTAFQKYGNGRIYYTDADYSNGIVTANARFVENE